MSQGLQKDQCWCVGFKSGEFIDDSFSSDLCFVKSIPTRGFSHSSSEYALFVSRTNNEISKLNDLLAKVSSKAGHDSKPTIKELKTIASQIKIQTPNEEQTLHVLQYCRSLAENKNAHQITRSIWTELKIKGIPLNEKHYVTAMQIYENTKNLTEMMNVFDEMKAAGINPPPYDISVFIWSRSFID